MTFEDEDVPAGGKSSPRSGATPGGRGATGVPAASAIRAVRVLVKAVPGSRRDQIVGLLGDRLKIKVAAPPEDGRANAAICRLLAEELGVPPKCVTVLSGHASAEKVLRVEGKSAAELSQRWK